jgi:protein-tyrosine phosphatase
MSRSATICIAYLMKDQALSFAEAHAKVKEATTQNL